MILTPEQRSRVHVHAGVPDSDVLTDALFGPRVSSADVDRWIADLNETVKPHILAICARMDRMLELQGEAAEDIGVKRLGQMELNGEAYTSLGEMYLDQRRQLLEAINPFYARNAGGGAGGINGVWSR